MSQKGWNQPGIKAFAKNKALGSVRLSVQTRGVDDAQSAKPGVSDPTTQHIDD